MSQESILIIKRPYLISFSDRRGTSQEYHEESHRVKKNNFNFILVYFIQPWWLSGLARRQIQVDNH